MKVVIESSNMLVDWSCALCGEQFQGEEAVASLRDDDEELGLVCPKCLEAGQEGIPTRIRAHAEQLETWAKELRQIAGTFEARSVPVPSLAEYQKAVKKAALLARLS